MTVDTVIEDARWRALDLPALAVRAEGEALRFLGMDPEAWDVSLLGCDDARIAALNTQFRGKATPTNVLSWPSDERGAEVPGGAPIPPDSDDPELGDIAIAYETCLREAETGGLALETHATHLIVHAVLHLLGYDHETDADAALMEGHETAILARLGISDPYA